MAISLKGLSGPDDIAVDGRRGNLLGYAPSGGGAAPPKWEVGNPAVAAMSGFQKEFERFAKEHDNSVITKAQLDMREAYATRYLDPENGEFKTRRGIDAKGMYDDGRAFFDDFMENNARKNLNERQQRLFAPVAANEMRGYAHQIASHEGQEILTHYKRENEVQISRAIDLAVADPLNQDSLPKSFGTLAGLYRARAKYEGWSDEYAALQLREAQGDVVTGMADTLAADRPELAIGLLNGNREFVSPLKYAKTLASLQARRDARLNKSLALEERALRKAGESAERDLYSMSFDGRLTREAVEASRDLLTGETYNKFLKLTRGEANLPDKSDRDTVIRLTEMAISADENLSEEAANALREGNLTIPDYRAAINEGQQFRDPVIKRVLQNIKELTGSSEMNPPAGARESYVNAKHDFMAWLDSDAGQKASNKERLEMGDMIANNYRIISTDKTLLTVPLPLFLVGTKTQPDIRATATRTEEAYRSGKIGKEMYEGDMRRIDKLIEIEKQKKQQSNAQSQTRPPGINRGLAR
jgi:hypothetical protein